MTADQLAELINNYLSSNYKDPTTLIVEKSKYEKFVNEIIGLVAYKTLPLAEGKITFMGCTLRVIFATNLEEGEVIVL